MKEQDEDFKLSRNYSVAFKMKVVEEVENGLISVEAARKLYRIPGCGTIPEWVKKYGMNERIGRTVRIMTREEELEIIRLRKEVKRLERALDDSQLRALAWESLVEVADEEYNLDLKKNFGPKVLEELRKKLVPPIKEED
jgi:transposase-like protein